MTENHDLQTAKQNPTTFRLVVMLVVHGIPLAITIGILWFIVPVFAQGFTDLGVALPWQNSLMLYTALWTKHYAFISLPLLAILFYGDVQLYLWLYRNKGKRAGTIWFWSVFVVLFLLIPFVVVSMFTPLIIMTDSISAGTNGNSNATTIVK